MEKRCEIYLPTPSTRAAAAFGGRPLCGFLYMVAGEVASIAKTYRRISKCALNMNVDTSYNQISPIFLWHSYHPNYLIPKYNLIHNFP